MSSGKAAKTVRIGILGGGFGSAFYWHQHPNCIVQAVCDLREPCPHNRAHYSRRGQKGTGNETT